MLFIVLIQPNEIVIVPGGNADYFCTSSAAISNGGISRIQWLLNDTTLESLQLNDAEMTFIDSNGGFGILALSRVSPILNATQIQCIVDFQSGQTAISSNTAALWIQGMLKLGVTPIASWQLVLQLRS